MSAVVDQGGGREFLTFHRPTYASILAGHSSPCKSGSTRDSPAFTVEDSTFHRRNIPISTESSPIIVDDVQRIVQKSVSSSKPSTEFAALESVESFTSQVNNISFEESSPRVVQDVKSPVKHLQQKAKKLVFIPKANVKKENAITTSVKNCDSRALQESLQPATDPDKSIKHKETSRKMEDIAKPTHLQQDHVEITRPKNKRNERPVVAKRENKENLYNDEKRKSFKIDRDGWQTKVPNAKKNKNEKPLQQPTQRDKRYTEQVRGGGGAAAGGGSQRFSYGQNSFQKNREIRSDARGRRQTVYYSNTRNTPYSRAQSKNSVYSVASGDSPSARSESPITFTVPYTPSSSSPVITRPELTPPPPPASGTFSYRDVLRKGLSPVQCLQEPSSNVRLSSDTSDPRTPSKPVTKEVITLSRRQNAEIEEETKIDQPVAVSDKPTKEETEISHNLHKQSQSPEKTLRISSQSDSIFSSQIGTEKESVKNYSVSSDNSNGTVSKHDSRSDYAAFQPLQDTSNSVPIEAAPFDTSDFNNNSLVSKDFPQTFVDSGVPSQTNSLVNDHLSVSEHEAQKHCFAATESQTFSDCKIVPPAQDQLDHSIHETGSVSKISSGKIENSAEEQLQKKWVEEKLNKNLLLQVDSSLKPTYTNENKSELHIVAENDLESKTKNNCEETDNCASKIDHQKNVHKMPLLPSKSYSAILKTGTEITLNKTLNETNLLLPSTPLPKTQIIDLQSEPKSVINSSSVKSSDSSININESHELKENSPVKPNEMSGPETFSFSRNKKKCISESMYSLSQIDRSNDLGESTESLVFNQINREDPSVLPSLLQLRSVESFPAPPPPTPNELVQSDSQNMFQCTSLQCLPDYSFDLITCAAKELEIHSLASSGVDLNEDEQKEADAACSDAGKTVKVENEHLRSEPEIAEQKYCSLDGTKSKRKSESGTVLLETCQSSLSEESLNLESNDGNGSQKSHDGIILDFNNNDTSCDISLDAKSDKISKFRLPNAALKILFQVIPQEKKDVLFPDAGKTWTPESSERITDNNVLPQRPQKMKTNFPQSLDDNSQKIETLVNEETTKQGGNGNAPVVDVMSESSKEINESISKLENKTSPRPSKTWLGSDSSVSKSIYDTIQQLSDSSTIEQSLSSYSASCQSEISSNTNHIWSTASSKPILALTRNSFLDLEKPETSPLETLLKNPASSVNSTSDSSNSLHNRSNTDNSKQSTDPSDQSIDQTFQNFNKMPDVIMSQSNLMANVPSVSSGEQMYNFMQQKTNSYANRPLTIPSAIPQLMQHPNTSPYVQQNPHANQPQTGMQPVSEMEYNTLPRLTPSQHLNIPQHQINYVPPSTPVQYPGIHDPRWARNYSVDVAQSDWLNINRFPSGERDFTRPPPLHALSQPINIYSFPPPLPHPSQKDIFPNFNYPPPPFQQGYRLQTLPAFMQRPPPPLQPHLNSNLYNRGTGIIPQRASQRQSPELRDRNGFNVAQSNRIDGDRIRQSGLQPELYQEVTGKNSTNDGYRGRYAGDGVSTEENRYSNPQGNRNNRQLPSHHPQETTFGDYLPGNLDNFKSEKTSNSSLSQTWKKNYNDRRVYGGRKNYKNDQKENVYSALSPPETGFSENDTQLGSRRKSTYKGNLGTVNDPSKSIPKLPSQDQRINSQAEYEGPKTDREYGGYGAERPQIPLYYANTSDMFMTGQLYPTIMAPVELSFNQMACEYDAAKEPVFDKVETSNTDYNNNTQNNYDDSQVGQTTVLVDNTQEFCTGGWKYYNEALTAPSGLRIHQNTYIPYPNPCASMQATYLSTNDVRARMQWLGFKKAFEVYTEKINSKGTVRMDVTVVCSKGSAVCCNSDILATCSAYFNERLFERTDEYITIFVNVPSKIMKHFLQMMSCGEAFVPVNDMNEVIIKSPIYLNLNM